jgi:hypothetical protein
MRKKHRKDALMLSCISGFVFAALVGIGVTGLFFLQKLDNDALSEANFSQILQEFDDSFTILVETRDVQHINAAFNKLEKQAVSVESLLSVLKRWRNLARNDERFISVYQKASQNAAARYPASQLLAAVASESLLWGMDFNEENTNLLHSYAARMSQGGLTKPALSIYVLLGDMNSPEKASTIPGELLDLGNRFDADEAILSVLKGDVAAASVQINAILTKKDVSQLEKEFAAEFFYNYDKPAQAAEIFSQFPGENNMLRQAEALYLADAKQSVRNLWTLLLSSQQSQVRAESLYNLASAETNLDKKRDYLAQLVEAVQAEDLKDSVYELYGVLSYTRLLPAKDAIDTLERFFAWGEKPLADMEKVRRGREVWTQDKTIAQTWLLLNAYQQNETLHQWAAWFFDFERRYEETDILVNNPALNAVAGNWLVMHEAIGLIRNNELASAQELLESSIQEDASWAVYANIARIYETSRSLEAIEKAVDYYRKALSQDAEKSSENAARLQYRLSRRLRLLNRDAESRAALEAAIELKPDYLDAITELKRTVEVE